MRTSENIAAHDMADALQLDESGKRSKGQARTQQAVGSLKFMEKSTPIISLIRTTASHA